jgi:hypothetical protein
MASNPYEQFLIPSDSNQQAAVATDQGGAVGPSGEQLNLPPNTGAENIAGGIPAAVTDNPYSQFLQPQQQQQALPQSDPNDLTSNYTQSVPQATPQDNTKDNPYAQFLQPTPTPLPIQEQTAKPINLPAMPWYENLAKSAAAQTEAGAIQMAGGFERAGAAPVTDISGVNAPFQRGATTKEATSAFDTAIEDKQSALDSLQDIVKKQGFSTAEYSNQISDLQQQIGDLQAQKKETLQLPQYAPEAQQQLSEERQQLGQEASALSEQAAGAFPAFGVNQQDTSIAAQLGRGFGNVIDLVPGMATGVLALPAMVIMGGSQAYGESYDNKVQELKKQGVTDQAILDSAGHRAGSEAAVATVPQLAAYTVGGELTAGATFALMKGASPLARAAVAGTAAAGVNLATSGALRTMQGGNFLPNVEQAVPDLAFGGVAAFHAGMAPSANPVVNQREGEIIRKANAQKDVPLTPDQEKINQQWQVLKQQAVDVSNQLGNLPEDHPDRPALQQKAQNIANQIADLRAGKPIEIETPSAEPQGDERFAPKPTEITKGAQDILDLINTGTDPNSLSRTTLLEAAAQNGVRIPEGATNAQIVEALRQHQTELKNAVQVKTTGEVGVRNAPAVGEGVGEQNKPEEATTQGEKPKEEVAPNTLSEEESKDPIAKLNKSTPQKDGTNLFEPATQEEIDAQKQNPVFILADKLAGIFGKKVVLYRSKPGRQINGAVNRGMKGYIFLNVDGTRPHLFTAGHELWHSIEVNAPKLYQSLRKELDALVKDRAGLEAKYRPAGYKPERYVDEHIGDLLGDALQDPDFWNKLADRNPEAFKSLAEKTIDWLNSVIDKLKGWAMGGGEHTRDLERARNMLADGLNNFAKGKDEPVVYPPETPSETFYQQEAERKPDKDGFYSQLQRTLSDKMPNKASVEQIRAIIDPAKGSGVKPEELKWSNLEGFLEGKKSVANEGQTMFQQERPTEQEASKKREEIDNQYQAAPIRKTKRTIVNTFKRSPAKEAISFMRDAGDNAANVYAKQQTNEIKNDVKREFKGQSSKAEEALSKVIESKGDIKALDAMRQKLNASTDASPKWKKKALDAIDFAERNYARLEPIADKYEQIALHQVAQENANGIDTPVREGYVPHYQDLEEQELFGGSQAGSATGFRKMRTYDTFADSIANGVDPKSINAVDLLQKRLSSGQKSINYRSWIDSLKSTIDPASGDPIATKVSIVKRPDGSSYLQVPRGYHQETLAGQRVAIKDGYEGIMSALNDPSAWSKSMAGKTIQNAAGSSKALALFIDTFHLGRLAIWFSTIKPLGISTFKAPIPTYRKGITLLDHSVSELNKMIANGEIPKSWAKGLLENKRQLDLAIKTGYNIGGISDSLHQDWIHKIPGIGDFNQWLFGQFQRGGMAESWLLEFQRYRNAYPHLPEKQVARMVSKDLNTRFGNLGRQGLLKSKTMQDTARLLFLAPQWNEGLIRTELGALGQTGQALLDAATGKRLFAGVLARSVGGLLVGQFIMNQMINYATRGTPTWENPEEGVGAKISAWIPDVIGGGPGFFLNPMSLAMETTHIMMKGYERTGDALQTALDYFRSRSSVPMRPVWDAVTNKNVLGTYYAPGQKWKGMLEDMVPIPIPAGAVYSAAKQIATGEPSEQFAGQYQKQLFSTGGIKLDQAPSDESRMYTLMNHFKLDNKIEDRSAGYNSPYSELNHALMIGNQTTARDAMTKLMETRSPDQIEKYYKNTYPSMRMLESKNQMRDFLETLTEEQRSVYDRAKEKRKDTARSALDLLREMK